MSILGTTSSENNWKYASMISCDAVEVVTNAETCDKWIAYKRRFWQRTLLSFSAVTLLASCRQTMWQDSSPTPPEIAPKWPDRWRMMATIRGTAAAERVRDFINSKISPAEGVSVCDVPNLSVFSPKIRVKRANLSVHRRASPCSSALASPCSATRSLPFRPPTEVSV